LARETPLDPVIVTDDVLVELALLGPKFVTVRRQQQRLPANCQVEGSSHVTISNPAKTIYNQPTCASRQLFTWRDLSVHCRKMIAKAVTLAAMSKGVSSRQGVKNKPKAVGIVAWIIIAPLILASANRSLP
jgi:hypothetical protein